MRQGYRDSHFATNARMYAATSPDALCFYQHDSPQNADSEHTRRTAYALRPRAARSSFPRSAGACAQRPRLRAPARRPHRRARAAGAPPRPPRTGRGDPAREPEPRGGGREGASGAGPSVGCAMWDAREAVPRDERADEGGARRPRLHPREHHRHGENERRGRTVAHELRAEAEDNGHADVLHDRADVEQAAEVDKPRKRNARGAQVRAERRESSVYVVIESLGDACIAKAGAYVSRLAQDPSKTHQL
jgi:hypothetical protein